MLTRLRSIYQKPKITTLSYRKSTRSATLGEAGPFGENIVTPDKHGAALIRDGD